MEGDRVNRSRSRGTGRALTLSLVLAAWGLLAPAVLGAPDYVLPNEEGAWSVPAGVTPGVAGGEVTISVEGAGRHTLDLDEVGTLRTDVFRDGQSSVFDVLVALADRGTVDLTYRYDEGTETYVIDALNESSDWWYEAFYDGGWPESNVTRMDLYPVKDGTTIRFAKVRPAYLESIRETFLEEVARRIVADGAVIVPEVTIRAPGWRVQFEDVVVTAHDLRSDVLQPGTITALDILLSLGEQALLERVGLTWYESIGSADPVGDFFVEQIDVAEGSAVASGTCGFVYEVGPHEFEGFRGSHIHIPTDVRVLVSPEYAEWFWICL